MWKSKNLWNYRSNWVSFSLQNQVLLMCVVPMFGSVSYQIILVSIHLLHWCMLAISNAFLGRCIFQFNNRAKKWKAIGSLGVEVATTGKLGSSDTILAKGLKYKEAGLAANDFIHVDTGVPMAFDSSLTGLEVDVLWFCHWCGLRSWLRVCFWDCFRSDCCRLRLRSTGESKFPIAERLSTMAKWPLHDMWNAWCCPRPDSQKDRWTDDVLGLLCFLGGKIFVDKMFLCSWISCSFQLQTAVFLLWYWRFGRKGKWRHWCHLVSFVPRRSQGNEDFSIFFSVQLLFDRRKSFRSAAGGEIHHPGGRHQSGLREEWLGVAWSQWLQHGLAYHSKDWRNC